MNEQFTWGSKAASNAIANACGRERRGYIIELFQKCRRGKLSRFIVLNQRGGEDEINNITIKNKDNRMKYSIKIYHSPYIIVHNGLRYKLYIPIYKLNQ